WWTGAAISDLAEVVRSLTAAVGKLPFRRDMLSKRSGLRRNVEQYPVGEVLLRRIRVVTDQSHGLRVSRHIAPFNWWRHIVSVAGVFRRNRSVVLERSARDPHDCGSPSFRHTPRPSS